MALGPPWCVLAATTHEIDRLGPLIWSIHLGLDARTLDQREVPTVRARPLDFVETGLSRQPRRPAFCDPQHVTRGDCDTASPVFENRKHVLFSFFTRVAGVLFRRRALFAAATPGQRAPEGEIMPDAGPSHLPGGGLCGDSEPQSSRRPLMTRIFVTFCTLATGWTAPVRQTTWAITCSGRFWPRAGLDNAAYSDQARQGEIWSNRPTPP